MNRRARASVRGTSTIANAASLGSHELRSSSGITNDTSVRRIMTLAGGQLSASAAIEKLSWAAFARDAFADAFWPCRPNLHPALPAARCRPADSSGFDGAAPWIDDAGLARFVSGEHRPCRAGLDRIRFHVPSVYFPGSHSRPDY
jgi:hypothetical protein